MKGLANRALIFGITGQDGALLARHLLERGYEVYGTSRRAVAASGNLARLGIQDRVRVHVVAADDRAQVKGVIQAVTPFEVYNLSGQSSVGLSFSQPLEAFDSHVGSTMAILEAIRTLSLQCRLFYASSGEIFGELVASKPADETAASRPCTPYGAAKASATMLVQSYRDCLGIHACCGYLFNHESLLRPDNFVMQRIVRGAAAIASRQSDLLTLGNLAITRDWGWAPDHVACMATMLQQDTPQDYVVATGVPTSLQSVVALVFERFGLDWTKHVASDQSLFRPSDIKVSVGDPRLAAAQLGWSARVRMPEIVDILVESALAQARA
ncbi:GDP-mannose 4,6-dehydratase [Tardiphaga sp. 866_E4_N2_1]|uniref:GDP-mannose 4,6-dehydratase n=1 Tax=unclassified Tardiphaga TaxID=2631404 RepID=UPI003F245A78